MYNNYIFIISAPSGTGKSSLLRAFLNTKIGKENFYVSISHTTRKPRIGEIHGKEYYFTTINKFKKMIIKNNFIEHAKIFKNYYGTSKNEINKLLFSKKNIILEIDWQGAEQTRNIYGNKIKSIFILPPSLNELKERLKKRNTDSKENVDYRIKQAKLEISYANKYDYQLINNNFDKSLQKLSQYFIKNIYKK